MQTFTSYLVIITLLLREHCESYHPHKHTAHHPLQHHAILPAYLFDVCVEGDRHVQQDFALLHAANKVLDSVFELVGGLVDLLWVALSRLGQLLGRLQQLVCIGVCILHEMGGERWINPGRRYNASKTYFEHEQRWKEYRQGENDKQDMQETRTLIRVSDSRAAQR